MEKMKKNKIVLVGDCHSEFSYLDSALRNEEPFDFFLSVGDVGELSRVRSTDLDIIQRWQSKGYFVRGNHDDVDFFTPLTIYQEINGIKVCGLNGMIKSRTFIKDTKNNVSFREIMYLSHLKDIDILVTHQPPTGLLDGYGEYVYQELLMYMIPKVYAAGHVHKSSMKFHYSTVSMVLPLVRHGYAVVYFEGNTFKNVEVIKREGKEFIRI